VATLCLLADLGQCYVDGLRGSRRAQSTVDFPAGLEDDDAPAEGQREADLGQSPVAAADRDHGIAARDDREIARMPDARDDDVVDPLIGLRPRLARKDPDRRSAGGLGTTGYRGHHLAVPAADHRDAALREQPANLLGPILVLTPAPDHRDLAAHCPPLMKEYSRSMENDELRRLLLVATIVALSLTALIAIFALLAADFGETELRILATTAGFGLVSLIAMRGTVLLDQGRQQTLARAVIGFSALAFLIELWAVWLDTDDSAAWKSYVCAIAIATALGQVAGMLARRRPTDPPSIGPLVWASGTCAVVLALMAINAAVWEIDDAGYYQLFGVVTVLDVLGIALQPVVRRLGGPTSRPEIAPRANRFVCVLANGQAIEREAGADLPDAVAKAIRELQEHGDRVTRIELGAG
jgi:hypothetical protein